MPRRSNHHLVNNTQPQQSHQSSAMYPQTQQRPDPQVQRAQGVIFLSTNKPQIPTPQTQAPALSAHTHLSHQVNQVPAHHASLFQSQHMPAFVPPSMMQNPFFPYYHPMTHPVTTTTSTNELYTPNGGGGGYDESMQVPPSPIRTKPKRRSRYGGDDSDSSSSEAEFNDDEEDPDWAPTTGEEVPEPITFENRRGAPRGRRPSTTPRGRGRGRGSRGGGRGRGRGRGRVSDVGIGMTRSDVPPTLQVQTSQVQGSLAGRQTRNSLSMPSLDPQTGELTFGELVSAAVKSLNDDLQEMAAVIITLPDKVVLIEKVPLTTTTSMFVPVNTSTPSDDKENKDELALEAEDEDLIMAYEILQEDDKQRPFLCEVCGKASRSRVLHNRHLVTHTPTLRFACCICSQLFESHEKLKPHLRMHHGSGIFVCPEMDCEGVFQERKSLDDHDFACHPNARPFVCRFCFDRFPSVAEANTHEDAHDEQITASCMKCSATYKTKTDLKDHYSHMHEEKQCKFCEKKFENQPSLDEHLHEVHPEEMKPKPPPTPEPPMDDDDPMPSPLGGGNDDDDDDIVVVEEHKKVGISSKLKKPEIKKPRRSEAANTPKPGPSKPGPSPRPGPSSILSKPGPSPRPGPSSILSKPGPKPKPVVRNKPIATSGDVITLSSDSDDEKDPEWSPGSKKSKKSYIPASPIKRSTRRKAEYVIIVESRTDQTANDVLQKTPKGSSQPLTFMMGDTGDLVHVPTPSDPHPPDSLPIKEIMDVIKRQKLTDNTTIVIEDNKISSVKPSSSLKADKPIPMARASVGTSKEIPAKKLTRPSSESVGSNKMAKPGSSAESSKHKPGALVAKKRTGGIPRTDNREREKKSFEVPSPASSSSERTKPKSSGPIAKKRTGGSSSIYDSIKQKSDKREEDVDAIKMKHSRKESHHLREDLDEPIIVEEHVENYESHIKSFKIPTHSSSSSSHKHKKKSKSGRKKGSKSQRREEKAKRKLQAEQAASEVTGSLLTDYDSAPKRSLRIALKASVTDLPGEESQSSFIGDDDPIGEDNYHPIADSVSNSHKRRPGRPSKTQSNTSAIGGNSLDESTTSAAAAASNGQVVMKALVNGKWQDVVIGTKLANDPPEQPVQTTSKVVSRMDKVPRQVNAKKSTGGGRKPPVPPPTKITSGSRGGRRGRKGKNAKQSADCWRDDRYQYFSDGSRAVGMLDTSQMYDHHDVPDTISYKEDTNTDYGLNEGYGAADDDTVMPFSLSSYMTYHQDQESLQTTEPEPEDQGLPVIVSAYHVDSKNQVDSYHDSYVDSTGNMYKEDSNNMNQEVDEAEDIDEIPLRDPLAMDDGPSEEAVDDDPLGCSEPAPPPPPPAEPKKGTVQEAKSAISNLRSVLSQITFKR